MMGNYSGLFNGCIGSYFFNGSTYIDAIGSKAMTLTSDGVHPGVAGLDNHGIANKSYEFAQYSQFGGSAYTTEFESKPISIVLVNKSLSQAQNHVLIKNCDSTTESSRVWWLADYGSGAGDTGYTIMRYYGSNVMYQSRFVSHHHSTGGWDILILTNNGTTGFKILLNDEAIDTYTATSESGEDSVTGFFIGGYGLTNGAYGSIASIPYVGLWNRVLSDGEMIAIRNMLKIKTIQNPNNLRSWWA